MAYNVSAIRELVEKSFNDDELTELCVDYFDEVTDSFGSGMTKKKKVIELVTYFKRRGELDELLEKVKAKRPTQYEKYETQLKSSEDSSSVLQNIQEEVSEYEEVFGSMDVEESPRRRVTKAADSAQDTAHPLAGDLPEIKQWFLNELNHDEQVFVITAALFNGLERQELMGVYQNVLGILKPTENRIDGEA
jgi:hypothetical protein